MKRTLLTALAVISVTIALNSVANDLNFDVSLRSGVTVSIHADVIENPAAPVGGETVLCIHGLAHTGNSWRPLAGAIISDSALGSSVRRIILLNMPGRGGSAYPSGDLFGNISLEDETTIAIETLNAANAAGIPPSVLIGHSAGGLIVQMIQERLIAGGSSLAAHGVTKARIIGSAGPREVPDPFLDQGIGLFLLSPYQFRNAVEGAYLQTTPVQFEGLFFTGLNQQPAPGTPPPGIIVAYGYKSDESLTVSVETVGTADMRPSVHEGVFASGLGTDLRVIFGSEDVFSDPSVQQSLCQYLTGSSAGLVEVTAPAAVHDGQILIPEQFVPALGL